MRPMSSLDQTIIEKIDELIQFGEEVKRSEYVGLVDGRTVVGDLYVDSELAYQWATSCLSLLDRTFGDASVHYRNFEAQLPKISRRGSISRGLGVLKAAKHDYGQGFLFDTRVLIEAEVFGWDEKKVRKILAYYEGQTEEVAVAEEEAALVESEQEVDR